MKSTEVEFESEKFFWGFLLIEGGILLKFVIVR